jgi:hypothetical protein
MKNIAGCSFDKSESDLRSHAIFAAIVSQIQVAIKLLAPASSLPQALLQNF